MILTSTNALRAIAALAAAGAAAGLPVFAVGARTAQAARDAGFRDVRAAEGDASRAARPDRGEGRRNGAGAAPLLYLSATDVSRDLAGELGLRGIKVAAIAGLSHGGSSTISPSPCARPSRSRRIEAVLHYSRRSALAFISAAQRAGLEITALALPQLCLSEPIAAALRDAGASRVIVAKAPNEAGLLDALEQALRARRVPRLRASRTMTKSDTIRLRAIWNGAA